MNVSFEGELPTEKDPRKFIVIDEEETGFYSRPKFVNGRKRSHISIADEAGLDFVSHGVVQAGGELRYEDRRLVLYGESSSYGDEYGASVAANRSDIVAEFNRVYNETLRPRDLKIDKESVV